jgi:cytochrome c5
MRTVQLLVSVISAAIMAFGLRANAQLTLPEGLNRDLVSRTCGACHDLGMVVAAGGRSREGWDETMQDMTSYGMEITPTDRRLVLDYLATYLPVRQ